MVAGFLTLNRAIHHVALYLTHVMEEIQVVGRRGAPNRQHAKVYAYEVDDSELDGLNIEILPATGEYSYTDSDMPIVSGVPIGDAPMRRIDLTLRCTACGDTGEIQSQLTALLNEVEQSLIADPTCRLTFDRATREPDTPQPGAAVGRGGVKETFQMGDALPMTQMVNWEGGDLSESESDYDLEQSFDIQIAVFAPRVRLARA